MLLALGVTLAGCAIMRSHVPHVPGMPGGPPSTFDEAAFARKPTATHKIRLSPEDATVIGHARRFRIRDGDTLLDVARWYDLGYNEIIEANPGVDPFVPTVGTEVVVPTEWVLPCCTYDGIVVNIPEMRLFYFRRDRSDPKSVTVTTYPVGLGRDDRRTPRGKFRVVTKTVNPRWDVPESIRREHAKERGDNRRSIPGGAPDNPLGKYRLQLSHRLYGIHGTDIPWGIGMQVTHGCVRLYPEDIERVFPLVPIGTPVEFTYQPVKVGRRDGATFVEVHRDIYRYSGSLTAASRAALKKQPGVDVDPILLDAALKSASGVPVAVSGDHKRKRSELAASQSRQATTTR